MRRLAFLAACAGAVLLLGSVAEAHANYVRSNPASDARLVKPPTEVRVEFSEPPDPRGSEIAVLDTAGKRYDKRDVAPSGDPNGLKVGLDPIGEGGYLVAWTATSAVDGHTTKGTFAFVVGSGPLPAVPDVGEAWPAPTPLEIAGRAMSYAGIALGLGSAFFVLFLHAPEVTDETRRESWLFLTAGALMMIGSVALLVDQGGKLPPRLGALLAVRGFAGVMLAVFSIAPPLARMRPAAALAYGGVMTIGPFASDRPRRVIALAAAIAAALTATLVSHATAVGNVKDIALDFVHVVAVSVWTGGVVALLVIVLLRARESSAEERRALGATVWRFSVTALVAVAVLVTTGVLQSLDRLVLVNDLYETPYGVALALKIVLLAVALALGALNLFRWGPRLRAGLAARATLIRGTLGEAALFVVIIIAASFLTAFAPPAQPSAAAFDETHHVSGLRLQLLVASAQPGRNRYVLRVHQGLAPVQDAEKVAFRFTMIEHDMGEQELVASERAPGEYAADGSPTAMFGTWRIQAIVRLAGHLDVSTIYNFAVGATAPDAASSSRVISAAPYTLIVFTDPAQPQAGAPVTLFVVLIGQDGNPVTGKPLRASFSGPATQAPIDATEDAATLGPGRYKVPLAALEAGTWQITVAIGAEASGTYSLDVSR
jgi:copper transport protein